MSFQSEKYPLLASENDCTGCLACVDSCHQNALISFTGEDGHVYVRLNKTKCVDCKKCERVCMSSRNKYGNNDLDKSEIFAAWTLDVKDRSNGTSGGVFAALARYIIGKNGVVVGASLQERVCKHIVIDKNEDVEKLQGSKYISSSMEGIYKEIEKEICKRPVLFTGVGCQCAGVLAYFEHSPYRKNLITMDLICGGYPSRLLIDKFYQQYPNIDRIVSFRNKDKYELKVFEDGKFKNFTSKSLPLHGFNCELTSRMNCYHCQYTCAHRKTDITIGDLWNYSYMPKEHSKGISTIIVHSQIGRELLKEVNISLHHLNWNECINYCKRIVWGKSPIFKPRKDLVKNFKCMDYSTLVKLYCMDIKLSDIKLFAFRVYRFVIMRVYNCVAKIYIKRLNKKHGNENSCKDMG